MRSLASWFRIPALLAGLFTLPLSPTARAAVVSLESADVPVSTTAGIDLGGDVAVRADGTGFVVVYEAPDASGGGIFFKRYDANWQLIQGPVSVNTSVTNNQQAPAIAMDAAGNFVIVWQSFGQDPGDTTTQAGIYGRRYLADGTAIDAAGFQIPTVTAGQQREADVAANPSGQFVVVYRSGVASADILAQSYAGITVGASSNPTKVGGESTVNDTAASTNAQTVPAVAIDAAGNYVVTWQSPDQDNPGLGDFGIYAQQMGQNGGRVGAEFRVNSTAAGDQQFPDIAMDGSGNFNIVWYSENIDGSGTAIVLQRYNAVGVAQGGNIQVNTGITVNNQINPHIAMSAGGIIVTWTGEEADQDNSGTDVYFKRYNSAGGVLIGDTAISPATVSNDAGEDNAVVAINTAGDFVILFDSGASGTFDVYLRRFAEDADVSFTAAISSGNENTNGTIGLTRTGAGYVRANVATTVQVTRTGGTANPGTDFTTTFPTTVTFPANGSTAQNLTIAVGEDTTQETDETIVLGLGTVTGGTASGQTTHTYTILDNDLALMSVNDPTATEADSGTTTVTFTVSLNAASPNTVTANYATANNTAAAGSDYVAASGTVTFAPGQTTQTVNVTVNGDRLFEGNETFFLNLSSPTNAVLGDSQSVAMIVDNDAPASIAVVSGNNQATTINAAFAAPLVVEVRNAGGSLVQGISVVFTAPASGASATFTNTTNSILVGSNASGQGSTGTVSANGSAGSYTVAAQAVGGTAPSTSFSLTNQLIEISVADSSVTEGDSSTATVAFTVSLSQAVATSTTVNYATADGTATIADGDYVATSGTLTFNPGQTSRVVDVTINGDTKYEANETFFLNLSNPGSATITDGQGVATIGNNDSAPTLSINNVALAEGTSGNTAFTFAVSLSAASGLTTTVNYATADAGAVAGSDYTATSGSLTFSPGTTTQSVTVQVTGGTVFEGDQAFSVNLSAPTNATIADGQGTGTILNDDAAPTLTVNDVTVSEAAGTATFSVTRTGATELAALVDYATADGTAVSTAGGAGRPDFTATSGSLTIAASLAATASLPVTVVLANDSVYEAAEQLAVNLSNATNATLVDAQGVVTITDDDAAPTLAIDDVSVGEGNGAQTFTVTLTGATALPIGVTFATADGTAVSSGSATPGTPDFTATSGSLTFSPSASATQTLTISVPLVDDSVFEPTEQFAVNLSGATNGATIADAQGVGTITNEDVVPTFSIDDVTLAEGDGGVTALNFTVTLSAASGSTTTVAYTTADGTALAGSDYTAASGALTFAPGVTTQTITVLAVGDTVFEADQTLAVNLSQATNATIADNQGLGTIVNDDAAPTLSISDASAAESAGTITFTVTRTGATEAAVSVSWQTVSDTAVSAGAPMFKPDYSSTSDTLGFPASLAATATQTFTVPLVDDTVYEATEQFFVTLYSPAGATIADGQGVGTITDDDAAPTLSIDDVSVGEDNGPATLTITLTGATALAIAVDYATADGTAVAATDSSPGTPDYTAASGTLTFAASNSPTQTLTVQVPLTDDTTFEATEQLAVNLSNVSNGGTISDGQGIATILDNDTTPTLSIADVSGSEPDSGAETYTFSVTLSAPSGLTTTVSYATADGTATTADGDYAATSSTLTFLPGETTKNISVTVNGDTKVEPTETFTVQLSGPANATLARGTATGTINNDDVPVVTLSSTVIPQAATSLTINGSSFDPTPANNTVVFNLGAAGTVTAATTQSLTVSFTTGPASGGSLTAVVTTNGTSSGDPVQVAIVDAVPALQDDVAFVNPQSSVDIDVLANDSDSGGDTLTVTAVSTPAHGTATIIENGTKIRYETTETKVTPDTFTYTVTDSHGTTATANVFVSNQRTSQAGTYNGLIEPAPANLTPTNDHVGVLKVTINGATSKFTATLQLGGQKFTATGTFDPDGSARFAKTNDTSVVLKKLPDGSEVRLELNIVFAPVIVEMEGSVSIGGTVVSVVAAERALYTDKKNPAEPFENVPAGLLGKYTVAFLALSPADQGLAANQYPQGHGGGFVTVAKTGAVRFTGTLADGTKITAANTLATSGRWPFYAALAGGKGSLSGFTLFRDEPESDVDSLDMRWFKPANAAAKYYPNGWPAGIGTDLIGSKLVVPPRNPPTSIFPGLTAVDADGNAVIEFGVPSSDTIAPRAVAGSRLSKAVNISPRDVATVVLPGPDQLKLILRNQQSTPPTVIGFYEDGGEFINLIQPGTTSTSSPGAFRGSFRDPATSRVTKYQGVILQKISRGLGFFLGATESEPVLLAPTGNAAIAP